MLCSYFCGQGQYSIDSSLSMKGNGVPKKIRKSQEDGCSQTFIANYKNIACYMGQIVLGARCRLENRTSIPKGSERSQH
jgi:hypothetical protein